MRFLAESPSPVRVLRSCKPQNPDDILLSVASNLKAISAIRRRGNYPARKTGPPAV